MSTEVSPAGPLPAGGITPDGRAGELTSVLPSGPGRRWRDIADLLAARLGRTGEPCGKHPPYSPDDACPQCGDEAALRVYRAACETTT